MESDKHKIKHWFCYLLAVRLTLISTSVYSSLKWDVISTCNTLRMNYVPHEKWLTGHFAQSRHSIKNTAVYFTTFKTTVWPTTLKNTKTTAATTTTQKWQCRLHSKS